MTPLADTRRPGCQGNDSSLTLSSRDDSLDHPHGGSLDLALVPAQDYVGRFLMGFKDYRQCQKAASFKLGEVLNKLKASGGSK